MIKTNLPVFILNYKMAHLKNDLSARQKIIMQLLH